MPKLFIVVNEDRFFLSHRLPIALAARDAGYETVIVAKNTGHRNAIEKMGLRLVELPIDPTGLNPWHESHTFWFLLKLYNKYKPDIVLHVGLKNILWGGLASRLLHLNGVVNAVSGLGGLFTDGKLTLVTRCVLLMMRFSNSRNNVKIIFQNEDDKAMFLKHRVIKPKHVELTKGSGIDLNEFTFQDEPETDMVQVIFTARMVREKGICDLVEAAEMLKPRYGDKVRFLLCGRLTSNKTGVTEEYMNEHCDGEYICWLGEREDVKVLLEQSHIMAFPSYYREGIPKSLIEACAIGRPIITCDSVGCRDVVDDGVNGLLIPPKNPSKLAEALEFLIKNREICQKMGKASRAKAERDFSIGDVVQTHMDIFKELCQP